ncbi:MAG: hypothetical protein ACR2PK_07540 [Acidimicrobiales bacterium]
MGATNPCRRAEFLRNEAEALPSPVAVAYRRRASELELEAHLRNIYERVAVAA